MIDLKKLFPSGSLLVDVRYNRSPEKYEVIYWDPITKRLELKYITPSVDIWFLKVEYRNTDGYKYQISQITRDMCYPVYCKPSQISEVIAKQICGEWRTLYEDMTSMGYSEFDIKKKMCECPWVFKADFTEDVYFRLLWIQTFGDQADISHVTSSFLDIEVDVVDRALDMDNYWEAPQPVNAVTLILDEQKICAIFVLGPRPRGLLDPSKHHLLDKQEKAFNWLINHQEEFKQKVAVFDQENKEYLEGFEIRLHIFDYAEEICMLKMILDYINKYRPWFVLSWNAPFDDNYIKNRIHTLGYEPKEFFIPEEFKTKTLYFKKDKDKKATIKSSKDFFFVSTYSQFLCQERNYAAIRKSQQEQRSMKLDYIGGIVANIHKKKSENKYNFRDFAYEDFINFLLYNVRDVVVQYAIEKNTGDTQSLYARSYTFATQYSKCFQETHIVRNRREFFFEKEDYIQACRLLVPEGYDTAYEGAYVAEPSLNAPTGLIINGKNHNNIIYGPLDADAKSYYPSTKMGMNQDPMSVIYKCVVDNEVFRNNQCINLSFNQEYKWKDSKQRWHEKDITGPILNAYKNNNIGSLLHNWFNVPTVTEIFDAIDTELLRA